MTKEEILLLRSQHKTAIDLAVSFLSNTPYHAFKKDLERIIEHNKQCILELDHGSEIQSTEIQRQVE